MANDLSKYIEKFTTKLDQAIVQDTATGILSMNQDLVGEYRGAGKIDIASIALQGLGDYDRSAGFPKGDATLSWEEYTLEFDRGREFSVDDVDDEERAAILSANLMNEFMRTKVVPEVDATRFARISANAGTKVEETLSDSAAAVKSVQTAEEALQDYGVELSSAVLFHTGALKTLLRQGTPYQFGRGEDPSTNFTTYDDMRMQLVSKDRFYTAITTLDGTTSGEEAGGYTMATDGRQINYIAMAPEAVAAIQKHEKLRYFAPDVNQDKDAHKWQYRLYHDLLVYLNKKNLIYVSYAAAAA
jgi:hypothetical protein